MTTNADPEPPSPFRMVNSRKLPAETITLAAHAHVQARSLRRARLLVERGLPYHFQLGWNE
jgi:hypothetical protein